MLCSNYIIAINLLILSSHVFLFYLTTYFLRSLGNLVIKSFVKTSQCTENPLQTFFGRLLKVSQQICLANFEIAKAKRKGKKSFMLDMNRQKNCSKTI